MTERARPTDTEIEAEILTLRVMLPNVRRLTRFGDSNHKAIDAQLDVLVNRLNNDEVYDTYGPLPDGEGGEDFVGSGSSEHELDSALAALGWLNGDEDGLPSADWAELVQK